MFLTKNILQEIMYNKIIIIFWYDELLIKKIGFYYIRKMLNDTRQLFLT